MANNLQSPIVQAMLQNAYDNANPEMVRMITKAANRPTRAEFLNMPFGGDMRGYIATNPRNNMKTEAPPMQPNVPFNDEDEFIDNPISLAYEDMNPMPPAPPQPTGFMGPEITKNDLSEKMYRAMGEEQFNPYTGVSNYEYYRQGGDMSDFMSAVNKGRRQEKMSAAKDWMGQTFGNMKGFLGNLFNKDKTQSAPMEPVNNDNITAPPKPTVPFEDTDYDEPLGDITYDEGLLSAPMSEEFFTPQFSPAIQDNTRVNLNMPPARRTLADYIFDPANAHLFNQGEIRNPMIQSGLQYEGGSKFGPRPRRNDY